MTHETAVTWVCFSVFSVTVLDLSTLIPYQCISGRQGHIPGYEVPVLRTLFSSSPPSPNLLLTLRQNVSFGGSHIVGFSRPGLTPGGYLGLQGGLEEFLSFLLRSLRPFSDLRIEVEDYAS